MKKLLLGLAFAALALPVLAALKVGDKAPDFSARASLAGKEFSFSLSDALKKGPVVVYFYPSAYTKGCDLEAHTFAEQKDKFARPLSVYPATALRDSINSQRTRLIAPVNFP
jgi:peroxiredoxin